MDGYNNFCTDAERWEIAALFEDFSGALALYDAFESALLGRFCDVSIQVKKTQVGFFCGCGFAWASPPHRLRRRDGGPCIVITLGLPRRLESARIVAAVEPYPGRWTHHLLLSNPSEIDAELLAWLDEAYVFAQERKRRPRSAKGV